MYNHNNDDFERSKMKDLEYELAKKRCRNKAHLKELKTRYDYSPGMFDHVQ